MSIAVENLRKDARARFESDQTLSSGWVVVPLLEILTIIAFALIIIVTVVDYILAVQFGTGPIPQNPFESLQFVVLVQGFSFILFIIGLFFAFLVYKLLRRRNTHFARQQLLYEDLTATAKELASKRTVDVSIFTNNMDRIGREGRLEETAKNPVLWVILTLASTTLPLTSDIASGGGGNVGWLPVLAILYVFYFLMKDFYNHERREDAFFDQLGRTMVALDIQPNLVRRSYPIPSRGFALYLLLSIVTVGFFWVYWVYVLINDPNNHFRHQEAVENNIIGQVAPLLA